MGRVGRAPGQNRDTGLDIAVISGTVKLRPFGWAVYLGNVDYTIYASDKVQATVAAAEADQADKPAAWSAQPKPAVDKHGMS